MPTLPVETVLFKAKDATVARQWSAHVGERLNVKDFGAVGDGTTPDHVAIQQCFDTAFGGPTTVGTNTTPHGITNAWKNRAVYFPAGNYYITSPLTLNHVYGGMILGAGVWSVNITHPNTIFGIVTNGFKDCTIDNIRISGGYYAPAEVYSLDLDWNGNTVGSGPASTDIVGLGGNYIHSCGFGTDDQQTGHQGGIRIGHTTGGAHTQEGHRNQFVHCYAGGGNDNGTAVLIENGSCNMIQGGGYGAYICFKAVGGTLNTASFHASNLAFDQGTPAAGTIFVTSSPMPCTVIGVRGEEILGPRILAASGDAVFYMNTFYSATYPRTSHCADLTNNARVIFDACNIGGAFTATANCRICSRSSNLPDLAASISGGGVVAGVVVQNI